ncbi:DNA primase [Tropicimonas sp. IMCC34043]|uniref:DNA primase n=1 Tax=Tropicimonas sp. IMCC34043 TaxID=2248760 RepID=UPI000E244265|nr:DNA primase [Tropicimonas sp. IMCC34043]
MSLPPGFLDELRSRLSLAQVVGRKVTWDARRSIPGKGDMWAPCPFHQEKTASFHVDDRKGFYYCFGCHAKGDAIRFVQETENLGFMEAIELLAGEAGLPMPERDPRAQETTDRRSRLIEVTEEAVRFFRLQLKTSAAGAARAYLSGTRGLSPEAIERWQLGFAPADWHGLWQHLTAKGIAPDLILAAGLARPSDKGREPYDIFRNRIMFPIRDARGRAIGFGGRAMDPADRAKYMNSPETEIFDKGNNLFNLGPAREATGRKGTPLVVAEGYMDAIALVEAGFGGAVANLGTAITPAQLQLLWRTHPEPVIALDGDEAGRRAAMRVIDTALPLVQAGQSLRFCLLPGGLDPDELIRSRGPDAMQTALDTAVSMIALLWERETEGKVLDSPERRAAFDKELRAVIRGIADPGIRAHYADEIGRLRAGLFGAAGGDRGDRPFRPWDAKGKGKGRGRDWGSKRSDRSAVPTAGTRASLLASSDDGAATVLREAVILVTLTQIPALLEEFGHALEEMSFVGAGHAALASALLRCDADATAERIESQIRDSLGPEVLERLLKGRHVSLAPSVRHPGDVDLARMCLTEEIAKLAAESGTRREIEEAVAGFAETPEEWIDHRLSLSARAREQVSRNHDGDRADFDIAENGARIDRDERSDLDALLSLIGLGTPKKT